MQILLNFRLTIQQLGTDGTRFGTAQIFVNLLTCLICQSLLSGIQLTLLVKLY